MARAHFCEAVVGARATLGDEHPHTRAFMQHLAAADRALQNALMRMQQQQQQPPMQGEPGGRAGAATSADGTGAYPQPASRLWPHSQSEVTAM